ncbi:MAG: sugar phosphate isomerase/epimerase [Litoreibacter sp.]|uniref:sugar phosphate isomerase/epimerase family protein n=1 Tax=Litoreibacter sp. TaxID=1969459 RepID=UPI003297700B
MNISLCTITFRHHLLSLEQIADWASRNGFQGIEIWGAHAQNIPFASGHDGRWLAAFGLRVPMISDYLPLENPAALSPKTTAVLHQARRWGSDNIRTFAGKTSSAVISVDDRAQITDALRMACSQIADQGCNLLIETHPATLADTLASTVQLIEEVNHPALSINFDALHVWEGGDDPVEAYKVLQPKIRNYHFKNIGHRTELPVFGPDNIYNAAGSRQGIVPLFEGAMSYDGLLSELKDAPDAPISLEWFGGDVFNTLKRDCAALRQMVSQGANTQLQHAS